MNRSSWQSSYSSFIPGSYTTKTVKALIIANTVLFVLVHIFSGFNWFEIFGLVPRLVFNKLMIWQFASYMFVHAGLWHLVVNMLMLWFFGPAIENAWGRKTFLTYYFFCGIGAGLCSFLTSVNSFVPVIGASGAIFGILVAYALMFPETVILMFFIFPMKIRHAVLFLAGINLLGALSTPNAGIAYFAHLGGGLFGYLYLKNEWIRRSLAHWRFSPSSVAHKAKENKRKKRELSEKELNRQVDQILDKISEQGIESLTRKEKQILEHKSAKKIKP